MAVYVDDMYKTPIGKFGRMKMSHMIADTRKELLNMAQKIGVNTKWVQSFDTPREHFDICLSKRMKAIKFGAIEITYRALAEKTRTRKYEGKKQIY
jgi:hypothetical protein